MGAISARTAGREDRIAALSRPPMTTFAHAHTLRCRHGKTPGDARADHDHSEYEKPGHRPWSGSRERCRSSRRASAAIGGSGAAGALSRVEPAAPDAVELAHMDRDPP